MDSQDPSVLWNRTWDSTGTEYAYRIWVGGDAIYTQGSSNSDHLLVKWDKDGNQIWNRTWGGSGTEYLGGIWGDGTSIYTCGQTLSWGLSNPYILKYDLSGNLIWNRTCNLRSNANGIWGVGEYLYVAGAFYNSVNYDVILIKFDSVGNVIWNRTFGYSPTSSDGATAVWGTGNEIYTCGAFSIPGSNEDMLFVKWDSNGNLVWNRTWGDPGSNFPSDIWGNEDGIYITGVSNRYNVWDMDGLMLLKYNSSGDLEWYKLFNSPIYEIGYGIAGNNDSIFTIGRCGSPFNNTIDALLIKWDLEGNQVSNHTWGGGTSNEYGYDVAEDGEFVYTCGEGLTGFFLAKWDLIGYQLMVSLSANMTFAEPGEFIQFKYTGSQSYDLSCQWNFGDGTSNSSEKNPLHVFSAPGNYTITLTVNDTLGNVRKVAMDGYIYVNYNFHSPVRINGNNELDAFLDKQGAGNKTSPYIIKDMIINAVQTSSAIIIQNTDRFLVIQNCTVYSAAEAGIKLVNCTNLLIQRCQIHDNKYGIYVQASNNTAAYENQFNGNINAVTLISSNNTNISQNQINLTSGYGIYLSYSIYNTLGSNNISTILLYQSSANIYVYHSHLNIIKNNRILNSTKGVYLAYSNDNVVEANYFSTNYYGIETEDTYRSMISLNVLVDCPFAIYIQSSDDATIIGNNASGCHHYGNGCGLYINYCTDGFITENLLRENDDGIRLYSSSNIAISNNAFINNPDQAYDTNGNKFDDGLNGNYWSDYTSRYPTAKNDGVIWNVAYTISGGSTKDRFPLVNPFITQGNKFSPNLTTPSVTPSTGDQNTVFTFSVVYSDADNNRPAYVNVVINGGSKYMTKQNLNDINYTDGCIYQYSTLLVPGSYSYYFECSDSEHTNSTTMFTGLIVTTTNAFLPGLNDPQMSPGTGGLETMFHFSVKYVDPDNRLAQTITITIDSLTYSMIRKSDYGLYGTLYTYSRRLTAGNHQYKVDCFDGLHSNTTGWLDGPVVYPIIDQLNFTFFQDDFESGLSQWSEISGLWHLTGSASAWQNPYHSPDHSMWFGSELTGTYNYINQPAVGSLVTRKIDLSLSSTASLELMHWRESEAWYQFDSSYIYVSTNDGMTWNLIYNTTSQISTWQKLVLDISAFCGYDSVRVQFAFNSFDSITNDFRGWLIDDVKIYSNKAINPPTLLSPVNGSTITHENTMFSWTSPNLPSGAFNYTWQLSNTSNFASILVEHTSILNLPVQTNFIVNLSQLGGFYYWRVSLAICPDFKSIPFMAFLNEPCSNFYANNTSVDTYQQVGFTFSGVYGRLPVAFQWDFGDGSNNSTLENPIHRFTSPGLYSITLTINDSNGKSHSTCFQNYISVVENFIPAADFIASETHVRIDRVIFFYYTGTEGSGLISYNWNFGDGSPNATSVCPTHSYGRPGTYSIVLTVIDLSGDVSITRKLNYISVFTSMQVWNRTWDASMADSGDDVWGDGTYLYTIGISGSDLVVIKWDLDGNQIWHCHWAGSTFGGGIWGDGDFIYACGTTSSLDYILLKIDPSGNIVWNRTWGGAGFDWAEDIQGVGDYLFVCGYTDSYGAGRTDLCLVRWTKDGNFSWYKTFGGSSADYGYGLTVLDGFVYTIGETASFGSGSWDVLLIKWNLEGDIQWNRTFGGPLSDQAHEIWNDGTFLYTCGNLRTSNATTDDILVIKWNTEGIALWNRTFGGSQADIAYSIYGNGNYFYTVGFTRSFVANSNILLVKWDNNGTVLWYELYGGSIPAYGYGVWCDSRYVYACGYNTTFSTTNEDMYLIKWDGHYMEPIANFTANPCTIFEGDSVQFLYTGTQGDGIILYQWNFGDGSANSTSRNPTYQFTSQGNYTISLTVIDSDGDTNTITISSLIVVTERVDLAPFASFTVNATLIWIDDFIQFTFNGTEGNGPAAFSWNFGDGSENSTVRNPLHKYTNPGSFTVTLFIRDLDGDTHLVERLNLVIVVNVSMAARFTINATIILEDDPLSLNFTGTTGSGPTTFTWDCGDGSPLIHTSNITHVYSSHGDYLITLTLETILNVSISTSMQISILCLAGDVDSDGLSNQFEREILTDLFNNDTDSDGLTDGSEIHIHQTDPLDNDTDSDGLIDGWEISNNFDPLVNDIISDTDGDGLTNFYEYLIGTDMYLVDSDGDGFGDGQEVYQGTDPLNPWSNFGLLLLTVMVCAACISAIMLYGAVILKRRQYKLINARIRARIESFDDSKFQKGQPSTAPQMAQIELLLAEARRNQSNFLPNKELERLMSLYRRTIHNSNPLQNSSIKDGFEAILEALTREEYVLAFDMLHNVRSQLGLIIIKGNYVADSKNEIREIARKIQKLLIIKYETFKHQINSNLKKAPGQIKAMLKIVEEIIGDSRTLQLQNL